MAAAAAAAAAAVLAHPEMDGYLNNTLMIGNIQLRGRLILNGFSTPARVAVKPADFVGKAATIVRKQGGVPAGAMTYELEEDLVCFAAWTRYTQLTQRPLNIANATLDNIRLVGNWMLQLPKDDTAVLPDKFNGANKVRSLIENIRLYLSIVKNKAGVPLLYAIRLNPDLPAVHPGFGMPDCDTDLENRGTHTGAFWMASNRTVWLMMRHICHRNQCLATHQDL